MKKQRKKASKLLPVTRSVRLAQEQGWLADIAERKTGPYSKDYLGFADIVAMSPMPGGVEVLLIQATSRGHVRDRERKILENEHAQRIIKNRSCRIEVWGWDAYREDPLVIVVSGS